MKCECGNKIDPREFEAGATQCEWCEYPSYDWVMWRVSVGGDWLEQVETHGMDKLYRADYGGETISVWANDIYIAEHIASEWLAQRGVREVLNVRKS